MKIITLCQIYTINIKRMKKIIRIVIKIVLFVVVLLLITGGIKYFLKYHEVKKNYALLGKEAPVLNIDGIDYRDLNKNGKLDIYEDRRKSADERVNDLVSQMNLDEKAGTMFITMIQFSDKGEPVDLPVITTNTMKLMMSLMLPPASDMLAKRKMNSFNTLSSYDADVMAKFNNNIQKIAERTRLGIPVTIATDPRHGTENNPGAAIFTKAFSQWPSPLGLAATRDTVLVREFGDIARQEYRSIGLTLTLSPMADLVVDHKKMVKILISLMEKNRSIRAIILITILSRLPKVL